MNVHNAQHDFVKIELSPTREHDFQGSQRCEILINSWTALVQNNTQKVIDLTSHISSICDLFWDPLGHPKTSLGIPWDPKNRQGSLRGQRNGLPTPKKCAPGGYILPQRVPQGSSRSPQGVPKDPQGVSRCPKESPRGPQGVPKGSPRGPQGRQGD